MSSHDALHPGEAVADRLPDRYRDLGALGQGAMGEVRRVHDRRLGCDVAMKLLRADLGARPAVRHRFQAEARLTANLRHPNIIVVHDFGELDGGQLWFTMQLVEGRTVREVIREVHRHVEDRRWRRTPSGWGLDELVGVLAEVATAIGYAHERGVVHRDIKPSNLMIGAFREVLVMDWGVARSDQVDALDPGVDPIGLQSARRTVFGRAVGTPPYMAPEQARGDAEAVGPSSDVYALGAVLYKLLSGRSPFRGPAREVLDQVIEGPPPPVAQVARVDVPHELVSICERAMHRDARRRHQNGAELAHELRAWIARRAQRSAALDLLAGGRAKLGVLTRRREELQAARVEIEALRKTVDSWEGPAAKRDLWQAEDRERALLSACRKAEIEVLRHVRAARSFAPDLSEAVVPLAEVYRWRILDAERRGATQAARSAEQHLKAVDDGRLSSWLEGHGRVSLFTDPPGAEVEAARIEPRLGRRVAVPDRHLGTTPLRGVSLPHGSWLLTLRAPGREPVRYPLVLERFGHHRSVRPGATEPHRVVLPPLGSVGESACVVPGGFYRCGGELGIEPLAPARVWVDTFVMAKEPVLLTEWLEFLRDGVGPTQELRSLMPARGLRLGGGGPELAPGVPGDLPVASLSFAAVFAYVRWRAERDGLPWRLPHEVEWEKAARGADGRPYPWGDLADPSFTNVLGSTRVGGLQPLSTQTEGDSIYGVRSMAGNGNELCCNDWLYDRLVDDTVIEPVAPAPNAERLVTRGSGWKPCAPRYALTTRLVVLERTLTEDAGATVRLVRSLE